MKPMFLLFLSGIIMAAGACTAEQKEDAKDQSPRPIKIVIHTNPVPPTAPRLANTVRIAAWYDADTRHVGAEFYQAGDKVLFQAVNLSTRESAEASVSGTGAAILPISGDSGPWTVTFTLASGAVYYGEFEL